MGDQTETSKALMRNITEQIWNQGRLDLVADLISEGFIDHMDAPGLEGTGSARYRSHVETTRAMFSDFRNELDLVVGEDDIAVSYGRITGTNDGGMMGMPATGKRVECETIGLLRFAHGKVVERWGVADNMTMMQQLGLFG
jgi:predicted ester cyclase